MIFSYFISFCKNNKVKVGVLVLSLAVYFALAVILAALNKALPAVASLPFKKIGVGVVVQKTGQIPSHMIGAIFPHSNGPIYEDELSQIAGLPFVQNYDTGLYFWYFGDKYFKTALGVRPGEFTFAKLLRQNIEQGRFDLSVGNALVTADFAQKNKLNLGNKINFGKDSFKIVGILRPNLSGNIIPADVYINLTEAERIASLSKEMQRIYQFKGSHFVNVVALDTDPNWAGDKEKEIKKLDKNYIVFSEKTFSKEIAQQVKLVSSLGKVMFAVLGVILLIVFGLLVSYNLKTREKEIAVLRMVGWSFKDLKRQFISESAILLVASLLLGSLLAVGSLYILSQQKVSMELPWEISAKPHFLPQENAINRTIAANLPVHFDPWTFILISFLFLAIFGIVNYTAFHRIKNIKPARYLK